MSKKTSIDETCISGKSNLTDCVVPDLKLCAVTYNIEYKITNTQSTQVDQVSTKQCTREETYAKAFQN